MSTQWYAAAECRTSEADPRLFDAHVDTFAEERETPTEATARHALAMRVCADCPVRGECLADALAYKDVGVRGGVVLAGLFGQSVAVRERRSVAATNRARAVLESLRPERVSHRPLSLSGGTMGSATSHSETPPGTRVTSSADGASTPRSFADPTRRY